MLIHVTNSPEGRRFTWYPPTSSEGLHTQRLYAPNRTVAWVQIFRDSALMSSGYVGGSHDGACDFQDLDEAFTGTKGYTNFIMAKRFTVGDLVLIEPRHGENLGLEYWKELQPPSRSR